jgi:hypothetical protein
VRTGLTGPASTPPCVHPHTPSWSCARGTSSARTQGWASGTARLGRASRAFGATGGEICSECAYRISGLVGRCGLRGAASQPLPPRPAERRRPRCCLVADDAVRQVSSQGGHLLVQARVLSSPCRDEYAIRLSPPRRWRYVRRAAGRRHQPVTVSTGEGRHRATLSAARWCAISVAWATFAGVSSLVAGLASSSVALVAFGANSLLDATASAVLVWRFRHERAGGDAHLVERRAAMAVGVVMAGVGVYLRRGPSERSSTTRGRKLRSSGFC